MFLKTIIRAMSSVSKIPLVSIDQEGVFKYILIRVTASTKDGKEIHTDVVRGHKDCTWHTDINNRFVSQMDKLKESGDILEWKCQVLGGGKIKHDPDTKKILVYGLSDGYGKAHHQTTVGILKQEYGSYSIKCND